MMRTQTANPVSVLTRQLAPAPHPNTSAQYMSIITQHTLCLRVSMEPTFTHYNVLGACTDKLQPSPGNGHPEVIMSSSEYIKYK